MPSILGANTLSSGYNVDNSLRFNSASSDRLNRTLGTPTNNLKFTYSFWIKRSQLGAEVAVIEAINNSQNKALILFRNDDKLEILDLQSDSYVMQKKTNRKFGDTSAWYHIVFSNDSTAGSPDLKLYVNGVEETSWATDNEYSQNEASLFNSALVNHLGASASSRFSNCYFSEFVFIDGQALDATSFGEFDSDSSTIWKPIDVSGLTFGTNGFYLEFKQTGTSANSSGLGADTSGNDLHFTVNNLTAVDQSTDTCTLNYSILNDLATSSYNDLSEGGLKVTGNTATNDGETFSTFVMPNTSSKWYWEVKCTNKYSTGNPKLGFIHAKRGFQLQNGGAGYGGGASGNTGTLDIMVRPDGKTLEDGETSGSAVIGTWDTNDILSFAIDTINGAFYVGINGTWQTSGDPTSGSNRTGAVKTWDVTDAKADEGQAVCIGSYNGSIVEANFGSPSFAISSGNSDTDGYGNFEYTVPSGYYALNSKNLAEYGG